jgi:signal transduction histidine kinase
MGVMELAKSSVRKHNSKIRILMPENNISYKLLQQLKEEIPGHIDITFIEQMSDTKSTILVIDRKESLVMELKDDSKTIFEEAIGLSTYSNSKAGVLSFVAIFENLWKQTELYQDIKESHELLKIKDKMQKEFINIAAHELRTPIQPILGLAETLCSKEEDVQQKGYLDIIVRNAKRLHGLTEDILDIMRIESKALELKKEVFNLDKMVVSAISDSRNLIVRENKGIRIDLEFRGGQKDVYVKADKGRINQVIVNLLNNAVKFTDQGTISIQIAITNREVTLTIVDTGTGIDSEISSRLFTRIATKSSTGTGLGLFISKSIIEAHGGKI